MGRFIYWVQVLELLKIFAQNFHIYHSSDSTSACIIHFIYILFLEDVICSYVVGRFILAHTVNTRQRNNVPQQNCWLSTADISSAPLDLSQVSYTLNTVFELSAKFTYEHYDWQRNHKLLCTILKLQNCGIVKLGKTPSFTTHAHFIYLFTAYLFTYTLILTVISRFIL